MTDTARLETIAAALWPQAASQRPSAWAVLDGARSSAVHAALIESRLDYRSLYSGRIPRELERASPQLVELLPSHRLTARLANEGWGASWGVFMTTDDPDALRPHLRRWLKVQGEDGRRYLFRFYDPRVLRAWLPTCTPDELLRFFGPVQRFVCEGPGGRSISEFSIERGVLAHRQRPLPYREAAAA